MSTLTTRLFIILSVITVIVMTSFVAVRYQSNVNIMQSALQERSVSVARRVATSVQLTIWNIYKKSYERRYSAEFAAAILDAEMQSPFVLGIKILGNFDHLYTGKLKVSNHAVPYIPELHDKIWISNDKRLRYPVREGTMTIGNIEIIYDDAGFAANLHDSLVIDITQVAIVGLLFVLSLYLILRRALVLPLQSLQLAHQALNALDEAVLMVNDVGLLIDVNPSYRKMTLFSSENVLNHRPSLYAKEHPKLSIIELVYLDANSENHWSGEVVCQRKGGSEFPGWLNVHKVVSKDNSIRYVAVLNDIEEKLKTQHNLHQLAYFDTLTTVPNRYSFMQNIKLEIENSNQTKSNLALFFIDLDNFKWTNDSFGHQLGDKLLIELSNRFNLQLGPNETLYRIGGDEFTIIAKHFEGDNYLVDFAKKLIEQASKDLTIDGHVLRPGASIGIATYPKDANDSQELIKHADSAMFEAKQQGRSQVCFFSHDTENRRVQNLQIINDLQQALQTDEFSLYLQPKVSLCKEQFVTRSVEALIRWHRDGKILYPPDLFIPIAEQNNLICDIGYWVIEKACKQIKEWHLLGINDISIAINLSPKQLKDEKLFYFLRDAVKEYQIQPGELELEITESAVIEDINSSIYTLKRLRSLGFTIAMDDFGTGYSSLSYLKQLPIDVLKIDRSFISKIPNDSDDVAIVKAIFSMAKALSISVVAEGIETREQLDFLIANQCQVGQGFYFSKPLQADHFVRWLQKDSPELLALMSLS
ncbi:MAG: EAL domain-containing protein [Oceanospirillaceae bacterium]